MKFRIEKADFLSAIATVSRALPARAASPVLEGILVEATVELSRLRLLATNTALQIECFAPADVCASGVIVLPGKLFTRYRRLPEGEVEPSLLESRHTRDHQKREIKRPAAGFCRTIPRASAHPAQGSFTLPQKNPAP